MILFSLISLIQLEKNNSLTFNSSYLLDASLSSNYASTFSSLNSFQDIAKETPIQSSNSTRSEIYSFIVLNPGIQFRGICTGLSIAIGTAEFHLGILKKAGLISFIRDGKYKRFFASKKFSVTEMKLISLLRHKRIREIVKIINSEKTVTHKKLASTLNITSQGLTWQVNNLRKEGIIKENIDGIKVTYSLKETYVWLLPELIHIIEQ